MSYDFYIGEAVMEPPSKEDLKDGYHEIRVRVSAHEEADAPSFPNDFMTGKGNTRHPGYSQWHDFCNAAGLEDMFYNKESGLIAQHPGTSMLTRTHADLVTRARKLWEEGHRGAKPGWCSCRKCDILIAKNRKDHVELDGILARLLWLEWWINWALKNCKIPAIHNH